MLLCISLLYNNLLKVCLPVIMLLLCESKHIVIIAFKHHVIDMEAGGHKLAKFPRRLRLSHVRHLARSVNNPMDELTGDNHPIGADAVTKKNASSKCTFNNIQLMVFRSKVKLQFNNILSEI